jgi:hypothetical protein
MRTVFAVVLGALCLAASTIAHADEAAGIRGYCEKQWPDEFSMQEYCIKEETKSYSSLRRKNFAADDAHPVASRIFKKCLKEWTEDQVEWSTVEYCVDEEVDSYNRLTPEKPID